MKLNGPIKGSTGRNKDKESILLIIILHLKEMMLK